MTAIEPISSLWAMKTSDDQPSNFAATQAGFQAALDYIGPTTGGKVWFAETITGITNLKMYARTMVQGIGLEAKLVRSASATGSALREYTVAEGNTSGATHIWLKDFSVWGNGSTGDGIDMGASGITMNASAGMQSITVRDFVGDGFKISANTVAFYDLHSLSNTVGLRTGASTGANKWYGIWCEGNSGGNIILNSSNETFFGVHTEETTVGSAAAIDNQAGNNAFIDVNIFLTQNRTDLITQKIGVSGIHLYNCHVTKSAAQTWTNTFRHLAYGTGTGADVFINELHDTRPGGYGKTYWWDSSDNSFLSIEGTDITHSGTLTINSPTTITGNTVIGVDGSSALINVGASGAGDTAYATCQLNAGDTGGSEAVFWLARGGSQKARWMYNGNGTFFDVDQGMTVREGISGTQILKAESAGVTIGSAGSKLKKVISATASLNFDLTAVVVQDLTITVTGAAVGDCVLLGTDNAAITGTVEYTAWVSAANTVTVRARTAAVGENPASGTFRATVIQF